MRLAIFDDMRLGAVDPAQATITDLSAAVPGIESDALGAGWWLRLIRDLKELQPQLEDVALSQAPKRLAEVRLRAPVLNPSKVIACAANYAAHVDEMVRVQERVAGGVEAWMMEFDVFLKAPSSIVGPDEDIRLPPGPLAQGLEVHHECELGVVVGRGGASITTERAMEHIAGYTICLDITVRGAGDRSRRKSYDTFTPTGPWVVTADEVADPHALEIRLRVNGEERQRVNTSGMAVRIPEIVAHASSCMRLEPGDLILTGAPPGVGQIQPGDLLDASITGLGSMRLAVRDPAPAP